MTASPPPSDLVTLTINGREVKVPKGTLVVEAAKTVGIEIPVFCYHPKLKPVGACRMCLVEIEKMPRLQTACTSPVAEGMVVSSASPNAISAQNAVLELMLANHPLDCPICDKGGECPLQDNTFKFGLGASRFTEEKRQKDKAFVLSERIVLDRERCIMCYRCTRFQAEIPGDEALAAVDRGGYSEIGVLDGDTFDSPFSGNTIELCPVGALTAKPYRFKARPWDLQQVTSTCTGCSVGCRISVHASRDQILRVQGVDVESVNHGWLCDRGRFSFQHVDNDARLGAPLVRTEHGHTEAQWTAALGIAADLVQHALDTGGPSSIGIIGGARLTNESAYAWAQLADALGIERRDAQLGDGLPPELLSLPRATINDAASASTVIVVGPDFKEEMAVLYLRLRGAVVNGYQGNRPKLIEITPKRTGLSPYAWKSVHPRPGTTADVTTLLHDEAVTAQLAAGPIVVIAGRGNLAASEGAALAAVQAVLAALPADADVKVLPALRRGNVVGALQLGLAPAGPEHSALATLAAAAAGKLELLVLLGADPLSDCPDGDLAWRGLTGARRVIALDTFLTASAKQADLVLAAADFGEQAGTTTNMEGRVSTVAAAVTAHATSRPDWMIAGELAERLGHPLGFESVDAITAAIAARVPGYAAVTPDALADPEGVLAVRRDIGREALPPPEQSVAAPNSYDYRLVVSRKLYDKAVGTQMSPALAGLPIGAGAHVHPLDLERVGVADGTDVNILSAEGSVVLPLIADPGVPRGIVWAPFNQPAATGASGDITSIIDATAPVTDVRIERLA